MIENRIGVCEVLSKHYQRLVRKNLPVYLAPEGELSNYVMTKEEWRHVSPEVKQKVCYLDFHCSIFITRNSKTEEDRYDEQRGDALQKFCSKECECDHFLLSPASCRHFQVERKSAVLKLKEKLQGSSNKRVSMLTKIVIIVLPSSKYI